MPEPARVSPLFVVAFSTSLPTAASAPTGCQALPSQYTGPTGMAGGPAIAAVLNTISPTFVPAGLVLLVSAVVVRPALPGAHLEPSHTIVWLVAVPSVSPSVKGEAAVPEPARVSPLFVVAFSTSFPTAASAPTGCQLLPSQNTGPAGMAGGPATAVVLNTISPILLPAGVVLLLNAVFARLTSPLEIRRIHFVPSLI
ncbi:hypothetical protein GCM10023092_09610 [Rurimicrobium arvi]|uniref:Uncharacterized protein n=1 Tax=Rurimicrobium arvi TaxID=2049916 RepID=A0ABP8MK90_9BACT